MFGVAPPRRQEVGQVSDRWSFVYLERCTVNRDDNAITATDAEGTVHIPVAMVACLMLGPGTRVTYAAMALLGDSGVSVVWVGEKGVRFYAGGRSLAASSCLLDVQARLSTTPRERVKVARRMYEWRFPNEDVSTLTMQQLRGREGARMRRVYADVSERTGVSWSRRDYDSQDFSYGDPVNQALSAANACLYGVVHAVVAALGCSPALGFVHAGTDRAFLFDVADLYKAQTSIPIAFEVVSEGVADVTGEVRRRMRDAIVEHRLLERISADIKELLVPGEDPDLSASGLVLWSGQAGGPVEAGKNYADEKRRRGSVEPGALGGASGESAGV